ncbi:alpha/beta-hydrolase [Auricularia subglabra TFB-10046 SS5]|nr:alpha/beta-hydrolase [Auricularia subglabra TFB-10046 SS5]
MRIPVLVLTAFPLVLAASLEPLHRLHSAQSVYRALRAQRNVAARAPPANKSYSKDDFHVDGSKIPLLAETLQDSYAGVLPLTNQTNEQRQMFFWYWPSSAKEGSDSVAIWLNGGPGCSSLVGFLNEQGAFLVNPHPGDLKVSANKYAWSTVSDMLFIEQPIGVGFSRGPTDIKNEDDVARDMYHFLQQFYAVFPDVLEKKLFITGESYAGYYIPYISQRILNASDAEKKALPIDLQGIMINDGVYSDFVIAQYAPLAQFATVHRETLELNDTALADLRTVSKECGFDALMGKLTYPPTGPIAVDNSSDTNACIARVSAAYEAAFEANRCLNLYRITDKCPGFADRTPDYFTREDVVKALHVDGTGEWIECAGGILRDEEGEIVDPSPFTETLFPSLIEALPRGVTIWHGLLDMLLIANGTRLTIQGMTWGGKQGFQAEPSQPLVVRLQHSERGLTYYEVAEAGHMIPSDQPALALEVFKTLIGKGNLTHTNGPKGSGGTSDGGSGDGTGAASSLSASVLGLTLTGLLTLVIF